MKYLLVMGLTWILSWSIIKVSNKNRNKSLRKKFYSQSAIHEIVKDFLPKEMFDKPTVMTQSRKHSQKNMLKVIFVENKAYWVMENVFYVANAIDGKVDADTIKPLDTDSLSKKELDKMLSILDTLRKGVSPDDSSSSRDE